MLKRIIWHWTAGAYGVNNLEEDSYNVIIDQDGKEHPGSFPEEAQIPPLRPGHYAAHTLNCNSYSIGISMDAMGDAREVPFRWGRFPLTQAQVDGLVRATALRCRKYGIPVSRSTTLSHAEVERTLGIKQRQKWDVTILPGWDRPADAIAVGDLLRADVKRALDALGSKAPAAAMPLIKEGSTGDVVWNFQRFLNRRGAKLVADGIFGPQTRIEAMAFQRSRGLYPDGVIGPKTWAFIQGEMTNEERM